jgi:hypothetical protein
MEYTRWPDSFVSGYSPLSGFYEDGSGPWGSIHGADTTRLLTRYQCRAWVSNTHCQLVLCGKLPHLEITY